MGHSGALRQPVVHRILLPGSQTRVTLPKSFLGDAGSVAVRGVSAYGAQGPAAAARR
ncbi:MAG: hypothetical protein ACLSUW_00240 [Akkermansia sp.]